MANRDFSVTLVLNIGYLQGPVPPTTLDVTSAVSNLGLWVSETDTELTKVSPSTQEIELQDIDGAIWEWVTIETASYFTLGAYPLWVFVDVDGTRVFAGLAPLRDIQRDQRSGAITITASDWSATLTSKYLGAENYIYDSDPAYNPWLRQYPRSVSEREMSSGRLDWPSTQDVYGVARIWDPSHINNPVYTQNSCQFVDVGDAVSTDLAERYPAAELEPGKLYKVTKVEKTDTGWAYSLDDSFLTDINKTLGEWNYNLISFYWPLTLTRYESGVNTSTYYVAKKTIASDAKGVRVLDLDSVDQLAPGDKLLEVGSARTVTIQQIDPQKLQVVVGEDLTGITADITHFVYDDDTQHTLIMDSAFRALCRAVENVSQAQAQALYWKYIIGYRVDMSRYSAPVMADPVLSWIPLRPSMGFDLTPPAIIDVAPSGTIRIHGSGNRAWDGSPEDGWTSATDTTLRVPWTCQQDWVPAAMMPDQTTTIVPGAPKRDRVVSSLIRDSVGYNPGKLSVPSKVVAHDYMRMQRYVLLKGKYTYITRESWANGAWLAPVNIRYIVLLSNDLSDGMVSAVVAGVTSGYLIVASYYNLYLVNPDGGYNSPIYTCPIPAAAQDGILQTTPTGIYLVGSKGYGKVTYNATSISLAWVTLSAGRTLLPSTFCHLDSDELHVLARFDGLDSSGDIVTETHLLRLNATVSSVRSSLLGSEKIMDGVPLIAGAMHDPTQPDRVIGHCGGRLYVYGRTLPRDWALERYTPADMSAMELIEHICQILCAIAIPDPKGVLHIVSRSYFSAPYNLVVDRVDVKDIRVWEHHYSIVRVSGHDESIYHDAISFYSGGDILEVSGQPLVTSESMASAVAQQYVNWFGRPRRCREETWFWADAEVAAPWESLPPLAIVNINGSTDKWCIVSISDDKVKGEATVKLVEVF